MARVVGYAAWRSVVAFIVGPGPWRPAAGSRRRSSARRPWRSWAGRRGGARCPRRSSSCVCARGSWSVVLPDPALGGGTEPGRACRGTAPGRCASPRRAGTAPPPRWCCGSRARTVPRRALAESRARSSSRCSGSRPVAGSSRTNSSGSPSSAAASATRCRMPPESDLIFACIRSASPTASSTRVGLAAPPVPVGVLLEHGDVVDQLDRGERRVERRGLREVAEPAPDLEPLATATAGSPPSNEIGPRPAPARWPASGAASSCRRRWDRAVPPRRGPAARSTASTARRAPYVLVSAVTSTCGRARWFR